MDIAQKHGLSLSKKLNIVPIEGEAPNRVNLELRLHQTAEIQENSFMIRGTDNRFTRQYCEFLKDFYLGL